MNTTVGNQLVDIDSSITNLQTNVTVQFQSLNTSIINMNSTIYSQTVSLINYVLNMNTSIYNQTIDILSNISNINTTLYSQTIDILTEISTVNSTLFEQGIDVLTNITYTNVNLNTTRTEVLEAIQYLNTTLQTQLTITMVHFALADQAGIGLPWETFRIYINETRQYDDFKMNVTMGTVWEVTVTDYYTTLLLTEIHTIVNETEIALFIPIYFVYFKNDGGYPALITIERNGIESPEFTVPVDSMILMRLSKGSYKITVRYQEVEPEQDASERQLNEAIPKKIAYEGIVKVSARLPTVIDTSTPDKSVVEQATEQYANTAFALFVIGVLVGGTVSFLFTNIVLRPLFRTVTGKDAYRPSDTEYQEKVRSGYIIEKQKRKSMYRRFIDWYTVK